MTTGSTRATEQTLSRVYTALNALANAMTSLNIEVSSDSAALLPDLTGSWGYASGVDGTVALSSGERVLTITATSTGGGTLAIDGGSAITIPAGGSIAIEPKVQLVNPSLVFTGTDAYFVDWLVG